MSKEREKLFGDFPPVSTEQWMEVVTKDLKGADFQKRLVWRTKEGFEVQPFYRAEDIEGLLTTQSLPGQFPYVRGTRTNNEWFVRQEIKVKDFAEANKKALELTKKGVTSFGFFVPKDGITAENISTLLNGLSPERYELNFKTCVTRSAELARVVVDYVKSQNVDVMKCHGSIDFDPFRKIFKKGVDEPNWVSMSKEIVDIVSVLPRYSAITVSGDYMNNAGAYIFEELGYSLAYGNEVLSALIDSGVDAAVAAKKIRFRFGVGSNYFMEIAKFRAARWLWAEIVRAYEPTCNHDCDNRGEDGSCRCAGKMNIHAVTSRFNQSLYDAYVNLLRTQTEAMSAAIGAVNSITVNPFDEAFENPTEFAERIALNQQLLLKEESHLNKVVDPASGSYYIETLTNSLAEQAWKLFLEVSEAGFYNSLKSGAVQDAINKSSEERFEALSNRKEILVGTNQYPNFNEKMHDKKGEDKGCETCGSANGETPLKRLNTCRLSERFEELRLATESSGKRPKVFMLTIGNLAMRLARSQFSSNFFACAGYEIIDNLGFETVEQGVKAAREAGADVVVLCSSDDEYAQYGVEAWELLKGGNEMFVVAGAPACMDGLKSIGVEHFIHVRTNVLDTLKKFNEKLLKD
ncbi:MAG: methylmalonyl-CoA mutase small subunit [Fermentimonas sp.]|jgi:methylmalonyl-CoA mutase